MSRIASSDGTPRVASGLNLDVIGVGDFSALSCGADSYENLSTGRFGSNSAAHELHISVMNKLSAPTRQRASAQRRAG